MKTGRESKPTAAYECPFPGCQVRISDFENLPAHIAEQHPYQFHYNRQVNLCFISTRTQQSLQLQPQVQQEEQQQQQQQQQQHRPCILMSPLGTCPECNQHFIRETPTEMVKAVGKHRRMYHHPNAKSSANFKRRYMRKNRRHWEIERKILPYMLPNQEHPHSYTSVGGNQAPAIYDFPFGGDYIGSHLQLHEPDLQSGPAEVCPPNTQSNPVYSFHRSPSCGVTGALQGITPQYLANQEHEAMVMWSSFLQRNGLLDCALPKTTPH